MTGQLPAQSTIGIIGGGQLGRMLAMAAARLSYRTVILEPAGDCPAAQTANRQIKADYDNPAALDELSRSCDIITYEFENVPVSAAARLADHVPVFPPPKALEISQDRLVEKDFLNEAGLKTAAYAAIDCDDDLRIALSDFDGSGVLKTRRLGYDGKGQKLFRNSDPDAIDGTFEEMGGVPLILEAFVPFDREISIIGARSADGSISAYDPAENVHRQGILRSSTVPANIAVELANMAKQQASLLMEALNYVGVIGIEFFVLSDGNLIANEFAPRVHNSGHWTEAACAVSQFEQHIRAISGLPLADAARHSDCIMENLIGNDIERLHELAAQNDTLVHLYGKADVRAGRKMGHATRIIPKSD